MERRIPEFPPIIEPVADQEVRPLWSIMIPAYNCSGYLIEAINSVLVQDAGMGQMQIEVIDDCSTDDNVETLVREIGKGRIDFFRQKQNVGSVRNFETCLKRSRGTLIHILHGDDKVIPGFYSEIEKLFSEYPCIGAAFTGLSAINDQGKILYHNNYIQSNSGIIDNWLQKISSNQLLQACAIVVKRSVYEQVGGFYGVEYGEDWEMWARIASGYQVAYSPQNLALYRLHHNSISSRFLSSGQNIKDIKKVINTIQQYLPFEQRKEIRRLAKKNFSIYFTGHSHFIYEQHKDAQVALKQAKGALWLHFNPTTFTSLLKLYVKTLIKYKRKSTLNLCKQ